MAQRVFSGMLNESLTILTVRYTQVGNLAPKNKLDFFSIYYLLRFAHHKLEIGC